MAGGGDYRPGFETHVPPGSDDAVPVLQAAVPAGGGQETGEEGAAQTRRGELDAGYLYSHHIKVICMYWHSLHALWVSKWSTWSI